VVWSFAAHHDPHPVAGVPCTSPNEMRLKETSMRPARSATEST
jgi:hypothetical protein